MNLRSDLWHFGDILACHAPEKRILIVQTTSLANLSSRLNKVRAQPEASTWLAAGGEVEVHGWALRNGCKRVALTEGMVPEVVAKPPRQRRRSVWEQGRLFS